MSEYSQDIEESEKRIEMYCFKCKTMQTFVIYQGSLNGKVKEVDIKCLGCNK